MVLWSGLLACGANRNSPARAKATPKAVVCKFLMLTKNLGNFDDQQLSACVTEDALKELKAVKEQTNAFIESLEGEERTKFEAVLEEWGQLHDYSTIQCQEATDKATCTYCCDWEGNTGKIDLVKQGGQWLVTFS